MPPRNRGFRALNEDFRRLLDRRNAWPLTKWFHKLREPYGGLKDETITRMKSGASVPEKYIRALIDLLRVHGNSVLVEYINGKNLQAPLEAKTDDFLDILAGPPAPLPAADEHDKDWLVSGIEGISNLFTEFLFAKQLVHSLMRCRSEDEAQKAVAMIVGNLGQSRQRGRQQPTPEEAIRNAERVMAISHEAYLARILELWRAVPETVAFAVVDGMRVGSSIVLPLKQKTYEALRDGKRSTHSCGPSDLAYPSDYLLFEALSERPDRPLPWLHKRTRQQVRTLFLQSAMLSLPADPSTICRRTVRILSFAGNPANLTRLKRIGFVPTGTRMPETGVPMLELDPQKGWLIKHILDRLHERLRE